MFTKSFKSVLASLMAASMLLSAAPLAINAAPAEENAKAEAVVTETVTTKAVREQLNLVPANDVSEFGYQRMILLMKTEMKLQEKRIR